MSSPMLAVTTSMEVWLVIDGDRYELMGIDVTFASQTVSHGFAWLAVGQAATKGGAAGAQASALQYLPGTPAQIYGTFASAVTDANSGAILINGGQVTIFDGVYNDAGPGSLAHGQFTMWVSLVSKYAFMNTGSLQYAKLLPNTFVDSTVNPDRAGLGTTIAVFDGEMISNDFWGAVRSVYTDIATQGRLRIDNDAIKQYETIFGDAVNKPALAVINAIAGSLVGPVTANEILSDTIAKYLNILFTSDMRYQSFFQRLVELGQEFKFRVMEHPTGLAIVPYSPFFSDAGIEIAPSTVVSMSWSMQAPNNALGVLMSYSGGKALANGQPSSPVVGAFKRTAFQSPLGVVTGMPAPYWMTTRGAIGGDSTTQIALPVSDVREIVGNNYAQELTYEYAYRGRTLQMVCPLRFDIGLLAALKVNYPQLPGIDFGTAVYGSVQAVTIKIDASAKTAQTIFELGYVRSDFQQDAEFSSYTHPMWTTPYLGTRLDNAPLE